MVVSAKSQKQKRMFLLSKINVCASSLQRLLPYLQQPWVERGNERWLLAEVTACSGHARVFRHDAETFPDPNGGPCLLPKTGVGGQDTDFEE